MKGFRSGTFAAAVGFSLVAAVVLGGMTWATFSTFELAKRNVEDEHRARLSQAVWRMDSYIGGILDGEMHRPFTDYLPFYTDVPVAAWSSKPADIDIDRILLRSELLESGPPHKWIDFYFQVDEDGNWSSPEHPRHSAPWPVPRSAVARSAKVCESLEWLNTVLPVSELGERVARARQRDLIHRMPAHAQESQPVKITQRLARAPSSETRVRHTEYHHRGQRKRAAQLRSRAASQCVNPSHGEEDVADIAAADRGSASGAQLASVGVYGDPLATFWLDEMEGDHAKLAFVRTGYKDAKVYYQGFVVDWGLLKELLLTKIADVVNDADLLPTADDAPPDPELSDITLNTIPVRLNTPELDAATAASLAWESVRGVLIASWAVAGAVLVVAGIGFRNLIALTERRMQFAYAVTHELRTPLTTFRLYADMLSAGLVPPESTQEYLDTLNRESLRLSSLVEGVLEYARLENHRVRLNLRETSAEDLLTAVSAGLEESCSRAGIESRTRNHIQNGLPIRTDVDVVSQIVGVLVNNACRHSVGADKPLVMIVLAHEDGKLHVDVIDSGSGIDSRDARTIFKPFRRGRRADSAAQGGIGLGLALARSWATLLGGRLDLVSRHHREYGGAHFRLSVAARLQE